MDWNTERVVPKEMDVVASDIQRISLKNHLERYHVSSQWLKKRFNGHNARILDIGCGTGFGSEILAEAGEVLGVDFDSEAIEYANRHYKTSRTSFIVGDAEDKKFLESLGAFDAIVSLETIEHLKDHRAYLGWVAGSLRAGGAFVVSFPSTLTMDWATPHHKRDISRRAARRLFKKGKFSILDKHKQDYKLDMRDVIFETKHNRAMPTPPLKQWIKIYLTHPRLFLMRLYQISIGGGVLIAHQQYLLEPKKNHHG